jgi:hypothetical protein
MKKKWAVEVMWSVGGTVFVEAETEEEARELAVEAPLPKNGDYMDGSFETFDIYPAEKA